MVPRIVVVFLVAFLVLAVGLAGGQEGKEFADVDGTWTIVTMEIQGKSLLEKGEKWMLFIDDGKATSFNKAAPMDPLDLSKILDPSRKPKTVTYTYEGKLTFYGIYEVQGDELRICGDGVDTAAEKNPEARRPKEFDSNKGLLLVFKRDKK